jgi:hypothetical protein
LTQSLDAKDVISGECNVAEKKHTFFEEEGRRGNDVNGMHAVPFFRLVGPHLEAVVPGASGGARRVELQHLLQVLAVHQAVRLVEHEELDVREVEGLVVEAPAQAARGAHDDVDALGQGLLVAAVVVPAHEQLHLEGCVGWEKAVKVGARHKERSRLRTLSSGPVTYLDMDSKACAGTAWYG